MPRKACNSPPRRAWRGCQAALFGAKLEDLRQFGASFHRAADESVPGSRLLVTFGVGDVAYKLTLATIANMLAGDVR
jgi:hypothetical protein